MAGWTDTGKGYFANPPLSKKIRMGLQPFISLKDDVVRMEPGGGAHKGDTIEFLKTYDLDIEPEDVTSIAENQPIPETGFQRDKGKILLREYGTAVPLTEKFLTLSGFDAQDTTCRSLRDYEAKVLNTLVKRAMQTTRYKAVLTGTDAAPTITWDTDGTLSTAATRSIQARDIVEIRDYAVDVLHMEPIHGGANGFDYAISLAQTSISRIINDPSVANLISYAYSGARGNSPVIRGDLALFQGVALRLDNQANSHNQISTKSFVGAGFFYGGDAIVSCVPRPFELRRKTGKFAGDYGRDQGVAVYGIMGFSLTRGDTALDVEKNQGAVIEITGT